MSAAPDKFSRLAALRPARLIPERPATLREPEHDDAFARLIGAGVASNRFGQHLALRKWFSTPASFEPSSVSLELLAKARDLELTRRTRAALEDPSKWLFLDTETTGLAGGTGTYPFLIGIAWWDAGGLQVEQFFMRDFAEEHSLLHELAARLSQRYVLVTFNGKAFDWPLLENRFTMTRSIPTPKLAAHLDLLHPARALWKLRLGSVRLIELERQVLDGARLGWDRQDDIASALIPQYYFDYLRGGPWDPLVGVVRHNQMDVRGLAALFARINVVLASRSEDRNDVESLDLFGLARFFERRGHRDRAHAACAQALEIGLPAEIHTRARRELATLAKRRGNHDGAATIWLELTADPQQGVFACEQLALYYEHHARDLRRAIEFARLGLAKLNRTLAHCRDPHETARTARLAKKFLNRIKRLESRKTKKQHTNADRPLLNVLAGSPGLVDLESCRLAAIRRSRPT
jgi:uncharacterized protein YprB with RNaseH-like and TPR domain